MLNMRRSRVVLLLLLINCWCFTATKGEFIGLLQDLLNVDFSKVNISAECESGLALIKNGLQTREIWALKALDASSHLGIDFVWGNNMAPGSPKSCDFLSNPRKIFVGANFVPKSYENITQFKSPIPLNYRVVHAHHHSKMQFDVQFLEKDVMDFAFCMPEACGAEDSESLFKSFLHDKQFLDRTLLENGLDLLRTKLLELTDDFYSNRFVQAFISILCLVLFFVIVEMAMKMVRNCFRYKSVDSITVEKFKGNFFEQFLNCFSVVDNIKRIFTINEKESDLPALDGLKAISMFFFIVGHIVLFGISAVSNFQHIFMVANSPFIQPLLTMHYAVDSFFVISATLVSYSFFEYVKTNKVKNKLLMFIKIVAKRYLRLTPSYIIHILLVVTATKFVQDMSPYYLMEDNAAKCAKAWWKNLLYISNYDSPDEICMFWSYYLSNDFQLYLIAAVILLIYVGNKKVGLSLFFGILVASILTCGYYGYTLPYVPTFYTAKQTAIYIYNPVWSRVPPYFVGIFCGWFLSRTERNLKLNQFLVRVCWTLACIIFISVEFSQMQPDMSPTTAFFYTAFTRFLWGIAVGWTIVACVTNHGGVIQKLLSAKLFVPFSRLTYAAYLMNPVWILLTTMLCDTPMRVDYSMVPVFSMGYVTSTYAASLVFCILFESPFIRLFKLLGI